MVTILRLNRPFLILSVLLICFCVLYPLILVQAQEGRDLRLIWAANGEPDLRGYRIYESDTWGNLGIRLEELLVEDIPWEDVANGVVSFGIYDVQPGSHCWAVTAFDYYQNESAPSAPACISIGAVQPPIHMADFHEDGFYGSWPGAAVSYDQRVVYTFDGEAGELLLAYRIWDVDAPTEVEILVNGNSLGYVGMTGRYTCSPLLTVRIPPACLEHSGLNTVSFEWNSAGTGDMWAVGSVEIVELIPLPAHDFYGNLANVPGGDTSRPRMAGFMFQGSPGMAFLLYEVYDVDFAGEIEVILNGRRIGAVTSVGNNTYLNPAPLSLPDALVLDQGVNTIVFSNVLNPPYSLIWGVGEIRVP